MSRDLNVPGAPALVVRDFGGSSERDLVLLHGFGGNALHWTTFAPLLTDRFRVVAPDLRCHGASGDGPWTWDALIDDLERVVAHVELENPAVVGHSLGGGVAALWAARHPECPAAVNLDGVRGVETAPENYPGLDPAVARTQLAELTASFEAQASTMADPLSEQHLDAMREQHRQLGGEPAIEMFERNLVTVDDATFVRPNAETVAAFRTGQHELDMFDVFAKAQCPLLICAATASLPGTDRFAELLEAQRRGVERDLGKVEPANPLLRVERVPASHGMVHEQPDLLAELIRKFLD